MRIATHIPEPLAKRFKDDLQAKGVTAYALAREIISEHYGGGAPARTVDSVPMSGNFNEDIMRMDASGISTAEIKKAIAALDHQRKDKNVIVKCGAFHEENAVLDIKMLVSSRAKPDYFELKYHFDWWYYAGVLVNVLARRGVKLTTTMQTVKSALYERMPEVFPKNAPASGYEKYLNREGGRRKKEGRRGRG